MTPEQTEAALVEATKVATDAADLAERLLAAIEGVREIAHELGAYPSGTIESRIGYRLGVILVKMDAGASDEY